MQLAIEAMEYADACLKKQLTTKTKHEYAQDLLMEAGTALRERLAQPERIQLTVRDFVVTVGGIEDAVGTPMYWAEWPNKEKNT